MPKRPPFLQLNALFLPGKEELLRDTLFKTIEREFHHLPSETIQEEIEKQLKKGFNLKRYLSDVQNGRGNFCQDCLESRCCTVTNPVVLYGPDVKRLQKAGLKDFSRLFLRQDGQIITAIKRSAPCMFLKDGRCEIYEIRPYACWRYPMSTDDNGQPIFLLPTDCQIGFNLMKTQIIDSLKENHKRNYIRKHKE